MITVATVMAAFLILLPGLLSSGSPHNGEKLAALGAGCRRGVSDSYSWCRSSPTAACSSIAASRSFYAS